MTTSDQVAKDYYRTTASRGHRRSRAHYDSWWQLYGSRLLPWLPADRGTPCVDLACGCGELLYALEQKGFTDVSGVDLCVEEVEEARQFTRAKLEVADVREFLARRSNTSVGFLTALNLLEHLPVETLADVMQHVYRVLVAGGTFVAIVPNALSPLASVARYWDITHKAAFTPNSVQQLASLAGFQSVIDFAEVGPIPHGVKSGARFLLWQLLRASIKAWMLVESGAVRGTVFTQDMMFRLRKPG